MEQPLGIRNAKSGDHFATFDVNRETALDSRKQFIFFVVLVPVESP